MAQQRSVEGPVRTPTTGEAVVSAVAELTDSDPLTLEPLYSAVEPDVFDRLFERDRAGVDRPSDRVSFTYCDCDVVVTADDTVRVSGAGREVTRADGWA